MKRFIVLVSVLALLAIMASWAGASTLFEAFLFGTTENPANASTATGYGTVLLDDTQTSITVNLDWTGLTSLATAAHIHGPALPNVNAAIIFPLSGVPAATAGVIPQQTFAINSTQVGQLQSDLYYMNVHTSQFPGGEIRGQLRAKAVPEPSAVLLGILGLGSISGIIRRRKA